MPSLFISLEHGLSVAEPHKIDRQIVPQLQDKYNSEAKRNGNIGSGGMIAALISFILFIPFPIMFQNLMNSIKELGPLLHSFLINMPKSAVSSILFIQLIKLFTFDPLPCESTYD
jgi:hypothetical protein